MKKIIGEKSSEFEAIFRIFDKNKNRWKTLRRVKFSTLAKFLSVLTISININTEDILEIMEELEEIAKIQKERLRDLKKN